MARLCLTATLLSGLAVRAAADEQPAWTASGTPAGESTLYDLELTLRARKALQHDEQLAALGLGVGVRARVATVWGTVPSEAVAWRVESCLRQVAGIQSVHNLAQVKASGTEAVLPPLKQRAPFAEPEVAQPQRSEGALVHRPSESGAMLGQGLLWTATAPGYPSDAARPPPRVSLPSPSRQTPSGGPWRASVADPRRDAADPGRREGTPLRIPAGAPVSAEPVAASLSDSQTLTAGVERLRDQDRRYSGLRPSVQDGIVTVRGSAAQWADAYALARAISLLPGVRRVRIEDVRTP